MDFDDLDEVIEERLAAGEKLEGAAAQLAELSSATIRPGCYDPAIHPPRPQSYKPTRYLPPIPRNRKLPGIEQLQNLISDRLKREVDRKVCIRCFAFVGAGDMAGAWGDIMRFAPPFAEIAVHEWPSHGIRSDEPSCASLDELVQDAMKGMKTAISQHAAGGWIEGAPFALIGHSVGVLLMARVAEQIRRDFGLDPSLIVVLDRAAPDVPMFTQHGEEMRKTEPDEFMRLYNGEVWRCAKTAGGERGERMLHMWLEDIKFANDTRTPDFHTFECDILVFRALHQAYIDVILKKQDADPTELHIHQQRDKLMNSSPGSAMDYDFEQFEEWRKWTVEKCVIHDIDTDHLNIKGHPQTWEIINSALRKVMAPEPCENASS